MCNIVNINSFLVDFAKNNLYQNIYFESYEISGETGNVSFFETKIIIFE